MKPKGMNMRGWLGVILICLAVALALGQSPSSKYQPGTITAVTARQSQGQAESDVTQYEVSVRVGDTGIRGLVWAAPWHQHW